MLRIVSFRNVETFSYTMAPATVESQQQLYSGIASPKSNRNSGIYKSICHIDCSRTNGSGGENLVSSNKSSVVPFGIGMMIRSLYF